MGDGARADSPARLPAASDLRREIPGVGKILAATILGETGSVERFASPKALGRFTGTHSFRAQYRWRADSRVASRERVVATCGGLSFRPSCTACDASAGPAWL